METCVFKQSYDSALLAFCVLQRLGAGKVDSFQDRLRSQKIQYFAQTVGISPSYSFNLYVRGPYSPGLASDLFEIKKQGINVNTSEFTSEELEQRFICLKSFIEEQTNRQLEISATLHWLLKIARLSKVGAERYLRKWKGADIIEIESASNNLKKLCLQN